MRATALIAGLALAHALPTAADDGPPPADGVTFFERFDTLDRDRWFVSDGWANGPHQSCLWSERMVTVDEGTVTLSLAPIEEERNGRQHVCGELQSNARHGFGTYEARIRFSEGSGTTSTFFTHIGAPQNRPHDEIDFEYLGRERGRLQTNYFADGDGGNEEIVRVPRAAEAFHTYAFRWEPDRLAWYVDGELVREVEGVPLPDEPQKIHFSIWSTDTLSEWLGPFEPLEAPLSMEVDWLAYTALGEPCPSEDLLACDL